MDARARRLALAFLVAGSALLHAPAGAATEVDEPPPYRTRHFDLVDLPFDRLPWTGESPPLLTRQPPADQNGVKLFRWLDGRLYYRPGAIAINGMKRIDAYRDTGDRAQLEQAVRQAQQLRDMRIVRADAWWLPFWFDYAPEGLKAPWFNAMSQGLALSFFVRMHRVTGEDGYLQDAERIFASFRRLGPRQPSSRSTAPRAWVAYVDERGYLWLEHYPRVGPDHVLNAHLHALIGIYEYWQHTRSPEARQLLEGALTTIQDRAGRYRREGRVSVYGLRSRTNHLKYHEVHIWQLRLLGRMTGDAFFTELGDTLAADRAPRGAVPCRPREWRMGVTPGDARMGMRKAPYPPVMPALLRSA